MFGFLPSPLTFELKFHLLRLKTYIRQKWLLLVSPARRADGTLCRLPEPAPALHPKEPLQLGTSVIALCLSLGLTCAWK